MSNAPNSTQSGRGRPRARHVTVNPILGSPTRRTPIWQRIISLVSLGLVSVMGGILIAVIFGMLAVWAAVTINNALN